MPAKGVPESTRRHSFIVSLLGIEHVVGGPSTKWILVEADPQQFEAIAEDYRTFANKLNIPDVPMPAGDCAVW